MILMKIKHEMLIFFKNPSMTASFDGAWQKRGTGHSYNSLSGKV